MIRLIALFTLLSLSAHAQLFTNLGGTRAGISALTFLKIDVSPRAAAMGGAQISVSGDGYAPSWNPAAAADLDHHSLAAAHTFWVAGISHSYFGGMYVNDRIGVIGLSATGLYTGDMERRTEFQPQGTGEYFNAGNTAIGLTYAKLVSTRFSFGLTGRYVNETLDQFTAHTFTADLGFLYRTDYKDLKFAVTLMNFGPNSKLTGSRSDATPMSNNPTTLESYPPPSVFSMGVSMIPWKTERKHHLLTTLQLNHPNDNAANIRVGVEFVWGGFLFLRAGYKLNVQDQRLPTFGAGIKTRLGNNAVYIDYAADPMEYLGWRQRFGLNFQIGRAPRNASQEESR